jgi:serine/threonine-protein kinase
VGLLGRGGMGEVYRADDLKLGQQVALKFISKAASADVAQVELLLDEVRMARSVSHPNVCRVWDIGEADGQHYVSMEYVDGEDLASLLRRIGRLPKDKAVEIARQLCAALAAAHNERVLHRDLKPANIMLDGRGRVKLTDFGLAAVAEVRAGTPIYMAPEQLAGDEVSVKTDIYSLGLVLHELFTGKRVFDADNLAELSRQHQSSMTTSQSRTSQIDPAIDRIIQRCLEAEPAKRPASALAVAAGLPGADPLAAALAAGETPSPEMVAEAGGEGSLPLAFAVPLLLGTLVCAIAVGVIQSRVSLTSWVPFDSPPAVLEARAEEIVEELGYPPEYADSAFEFSADLDYIEWLEEEGASDERWEAVAGGRPASIYFWWRSSPRELSAMAPPGPNPGMSVQLSNPPRTIPGMMRMDTEGRLIWLDVVPTSVAEAEGQQDEVDWGGLFELMDLDIGDFQPVEPRFSPAHFAEERVAWEGVFPEDPETSLRIEAAAFAGRPISLRFFPAYDPLEPPTTPDSDDGPGVAAIAALSLVVIVVLLMLVTIFGGLYVAQRNLRSGRGDAKGARRLGFGVAISLGVAWVLAEFSFSFNVVNSFLGMLVFVAAVGGISWALYLAVEPFMRRHAPEAMIGWTRFIDGRLADPLVGRDILLGCAAGALSRLFNVVPMALAERGVAIVNYAGLPPESLMHLASSIISSATLYVILALGLSFLFGLTYVGLRRRWWAAYAVWLFFLGGMGFIPGVQVGNVEPAATQMTSIFWVISWALWLFVLFRPGVLVFVAMGTTASLLTIALPTLDPSAWYSWSIAAGFTILIAVAGYSFFRSVRWKGGIAEALVGD